MGIGIIISVILFIAFIIFAILHNAAYGLLAIEESFFFTLAILSAIAFGISIIYNIVIFILNLPKKQTKTPKKKLP